MAQASYSVALFPTEPAHATVRLARLAEKLGYDGLWVGDSHIIWRELYVLLGAIASQTRKVWIGSGVTHPHVRHLTLTASSFATLCELAKGRVRMGIGIGASGPRNIGMKPVPRAQLQQAVDALRKLFNGEAVQLDDKEMRLMFASKYDVPIYMAANSPETRKMAARIADGVILGGRKDLMGPEVSSVRRYAREAGRNAASVKIVSWIPFSIAKSEKAAREAVKPHVARSGMVSLGKMLRDGQKLDEEDIRAVERLNREYDYTHHMGPEHSHLVPERWVDLFSIAGTARQAKVKTEEVIEKGVDIISIVPYGDKEAILKQFARAVIK
jgi:alkanesulfonate monooxygenase SsuD/methylene tetrahydromethanopterin reductase-like flavin-dependent oxidoreductase (luciferase family)